MSKGYVYVLTNASMPGMVKIGMTNREPYQRAQELYQTGVPTPFAVYAEYLCPDCAGVESHVHRLLSDFRVSAGREFFRLSPENAAIVVMKAQKYQVTEWLNEFIPNQKIIANDKPETPLEVVK